jgi:phosphotransferase system  glucose/maltose/N-acetylglucosamine-specific IIC component
MKVYIKQKKESIIICATVVVAYIILYALIRACDSVTSLGRHIYYYALEMNVRAIIIAGVLIAIPYEKILYIWNRDFFGKLTGKKSENNKRNMLIEVAILYGILAAILLMILGFLMITLAYLRSCRILTKGRLMANTFIYSLFAVLYIYTLLADLGFVPTAGYVSLVSALLYIPAIGIVIRTFITRKVSEKTIRKYNAM